LIMNLCHTPGTIDRTTINRCWCIDKSKLRTDCEILFFKIIGIGISQRTTIEN